MSFGMMNLLAASMNVIYRMPSPNERYEDWCGAVVQEYIKLRGAVPASWVKGHPLYGKPMLIAINVVISSYDVNKCIFSFRFDVPCFFIDFQAQDGSIWEPSTSPMEMSLLVCFKNESSVKSTSLVQMYYVSTAQGLGLGRLVKSDVS